MEKKVLKFKKALNELPDAGKQWREVRGIGNKIGEIDIFVYLPDLYWRSIAEALF